MRKNQTTFGSKDVAHIKPLTSPRVRPCHGSLGLPMRILQGADQNGNLGLFVSDARPVGITNWLPLLASLVQDLPAGHTGLGGFFTHKQISAAQASFLWREKRHKVSCSKVVIRHAALLSIAYCTWLATV